MAKVDRLTRSLAFLSRLIEAGVDVRFCDLPKIEGPAGRFMLQQMAAVAELEAGMICKRTETRSPLPRRAGSSWAASEGPAPYARHARGWTRRMSDQSSGEGEGTRPRSPSCARLA